MHVCKVSQLFCGKKPNRSCPPQLRQSKKLHYFAKGTAQCIQEGIHVPCVRPRWTITDTNSCVPVVWLHPPLVFCQHACNFMFTLTHLARWRFHPQWLSHQHPTSHTQPDKVVPLSHCFHILLLLFGCGKSWFIHKLMWFRLQINMASSLYIRSSVRFSYPTLESMWTISTPLCWRYSTYFATCLDSPENFLLWYEPGWDEGKCCCL